MEVSEHSDNIPSGVEQLFCVPGANDWSHDCFLFCYQQTQDQRRRSICWEQ
jgi:hypothetical protein